MGFLPLRFSKVPNFTQRFQHFLKWRIFQLNIVKFNPVIVKMVYDMRKMTHTTPIPQSWLPGTLQTTDFITPTYTNLLEVCYSNRKPGEESWTHVLATVRQRHDYSGIRHCLVRSKMVRIVNWWQWCAQPSVLTFQVACVLSWSETLLDIHMCHSCEEQ